MKIFSRARGLTEPAQELGFGMFEKCGAFYISESLLHPSLRLSIRHASTAPEHPVWVWKGRADSTLTIASGAAWVGKLPEAVSLAQTLPSGVFLHGARAFTPWKSSNENRQPDEDDADWSGFSVDQFVLPRFSLFQKPGAPAVARFIWHQTEAPDFERLQQWLDTSLPNPPARFPTARARWDSPDFEGWERGVRSALDAMQSGSLQKVVLARKSWLELPCAVDPFVFLDCLEERVSNCFLFAHQPELNSASFIGASPELLYLRKGRQIFSEALAATRPRSLDPNEEERLGNQLLTNPKELQEHRLVVEAIADRFRTLCSDFNPESRPSILKLDRLQHLITRFAGELRPGVDDLRILDVLHPTPAVCGSPQKPALDLIKIAEPFPRGLYAGPLGVLSKDFAEFCVAIRSMRIEGRLLNLYAGAGIVPGSEPEKEWNELDAKMNEAARIIS